MSLSVYLYIYLTIEKNFLWKFAAINYAKCRLLYISVSFYREEFPVDIFWPAGSYTKGGKLELRQTQFHENIVKLLFPLKDKEICVAFLRKWK